VRLALPVSAAAHVALLLLLPATMPLLPLPAQSTAPQVASIPTPPPAPTISADYRTVMSGWLDSHKRYPEDSRQRDDGGYCDAI
jgi:hypothetical protein